MEFAVLIVLVALAAAAGAANAYSQFDRTEGRAGMAGALLNGAAQAVFLFLLLAGAVFLAVYVLSSL